MSIRQVSKVKEELRYKVFCDECNAPSNSTMEDPGDLSLKAKKEKFVTVPSGEPHGPMLWLCGTCNENP